MIANRARITVIFLDITWKDLFACACCEYVRPLQNVACQAGTLVRVRAGICTVAADTARITDAVVYVFARDTVSAEAVRALFTGKSFTRCRNIRALDAIKAWFILTPIGVETLPRQI